MRDAFGVERPEEVSKDMAAVRRAAVVAGKRTREAPVRAQVSMLNSGDRLVHSSKKTRKAAGLVLRQLGYRPDYLGMAAAGLPRAMARA